LAILKCVAFLIFFANDDVKNCELRQRIVEEWERLDQRVIDNAVKQCRRRLRSCLAAKGGHFEQMLQCANLTVSFQLRGNFKVSFLSNVIRFLSLSVALRDKFEHLG